MSHTVSPSTHRPYGLLRVTRVWGTSRATVYRHRRPGISRPWRRPGPVRPMPDEALVEAIRELLARGPFHGEGYRKIWARLRLTGSIAPAKIGGHRRPLLEPHAGLLRALVLAKPGITLAEIRDELHARGITVKALSTIAAMLQRLGLSHKKTGTAKSAVSLRA